MVSWRKVVSHQQAQASGRERWYDWYRSDVARVDRTSEFKRE
jgi:heme-degrading monooxygenase HmoA